MTAERCPFCALGGMHPMGWPTWRCSLWVAGSKDRLPRPWVRELLYRQQHAAVAVVGVGGRRGRKRRRAAERRRAREDAYHERMRAIVWANNWGLGWGTDAEGSNVRKSHT